MSTGTNGDGVSLANSVGLDKSSPRIVVMEKVEMHTAQPALPADTKAAGATIDVRLASPVLSSIVSRRRTVQLPLMPSVGTVCPGAFQLSLVEADVPTVSPQEVTLVALVSSLLMVFTLAFLGLFFLYCKQFFNRNCQRVSGGSLQFEADEAAEEETLFSMPPGQETSPESPLSESIFETQALNPILDDDCSSTRGFPTQESFTLASCASESHSHWVHTPIECTELDLRKFSSSASYTGSETLRGNTAESSGDRLELTAPFEVPSL
ncbi:tumor necrosis factor receptor superfamily member 27 [Kogia breviceps]|uniref:tumor necrosis factor receptor superfamily member 27 n=1 Tax=Kogia breviceps TaxID=27615 RepID=UPI0034D2A2B2